MLLTEDFPEPTIIGLYNFVVGFKKQARISPVVDTSTLSSKIQNLKAVFVFSTHDKASPNRLWRHDCIVSLKVAGVESSAKLVT